FDGKTFTSKQQETKWIDYGPDEYAGITWSNTGKRKIFIGWMSNWTYANLVPTESFRNAMTITRDLTLKHVNDNIFVASKPVSQLSSIRKKSIIIENIQLNKKISITSKIGSLKLPCQINLSIDKINDFSIILSNNINE